MLYITSQLTAISHPFGANSTATFIMRDGVGRQVSRGVWLLAVHYAPLGPTSCLWKQSLAQGGDNRQATV